MCGIFGFTVPTHYPRRDHLWPAINTLGTLSVQRGRDSAGLAVLSHLDATWRTRRALGCFDATLTCSRDLPALVRGAGTVLGHTRAATQGAVTLRNASPLRSGGLFGTHNGDVDIDTIPWATPRPGGTDTAALLSAVNTCRAATGDVDVVRLQTVLSKTRGRVALAWAWLKDPDTVWLARGALSPLALGFDVDGGLWWASNPAWLRILREEGLVELKSTFMVAEGQLLRLNRTQHWVLRERYDFTARGRRSDRHRLQAVWRGFDPFDALEDLDHIHPL